MRLGIVIFALLLLAPDDASAFNWTRIKTMVRRSKKVKKTRSPEKAPTAPISVNVAPLPAKPATPEKHVTKKDHVSKKERSFTEQLDALAAFAETVASKGRGLARKMKALEYDAVGWTHVYGNVSNGHPLEWRMNAKGAARLKDSKGIELARNHKGASLYLMVKDARTPGARFVFRESHRSELQLLSTSRDHVRSLAFESEAFWVNVLEAFPKLSPEGIKTTIQRWGKEDQRL